MRLKLGANSAHHSGCTRLIIVSGHYRWALLLGIDTDIVHAESSVQTMRLPC
jgi:hypothetical protein